MVEKMKQIQYDNYDVVRLTSVSLLESYMVE